MCEECTECVQNAQKAYHVDLLCSVFVLPRWINVLARSVRDAHTHPERAMMNRYLEYVSTNAEWAAGTELDRDVADDDVRRHPMVPLTAVNSGTDRFHVVWPTLTKHTSRKLWTTGITRARSEVLLPILGPVVCDLNAKNNSFFNAVGTSKKIQIGIWTYSCKDREDGKQVHGSRSSWFRIKCKHVPLYVKRWAPALGDDPDDLDYDPEEELYGRFLSFLELNCHGWITPVSYHGECRLYRACATEEVTGEARIDITKPLTWIDPFHIVRRPTGVPIRYVRLSAVEGPIALGPVYANLLSSQVFTDVRVANDLNGTNKKAPVQEKLIPTHIWQVIILEK